MKSLDDLFADDKHQEEFPWCPPLDGEDMDAIMCTQERLFVDDGVPISDPRRYFVRPCDSMVEVEGGGYSSADLSGTYDNPCPLGDSFQGCGLATSLDNKCQDKDRHLTLKGKIGKVVHVPEELDDKYGVSFNDGRSVYSFSRSELDFLKPEGNYQLWFVQRNRYEKIIQKKKPFKVTWPRCTYDSINERYFPYAQLARDGQPLSVI